MSRSSSGADEDLEDGEIFDDEDEAEPSHDVQENKEENSKGLEAKDQLHEKGKDIVAGLAGVRRDDRRLNSPDRRNDRRPRPRRKRLREDEEQEQRFPSKPNKHRRSRDLDRRLEEEVDENEMMCMRGGNSPSSKPNHHDNHWGDRYDSQEEEDDRDILGRDRGRRMREGFGGNNRMTRRARLARGGMKRRGRGGKTDYSLCKFYLQGKCQRGNECPFSHNALPQRKMELCKFYMMDCCAKKDKCLYMHSEFPCKYYHMGQKCFAGKRCKFSHGKMTAQLKNALLKHLEQSKDMDGNYHRPHNRDGPDSNMGRDRDYGGSIGRGDQDGSRRGAEPRHERKERFEPRHNETRQISDEDESRTPMPSPQQDSLDRDRSSLEREFRIQTSPKKREHKDSGSGEDLASDSAVPLHLPKKQRELFMRIQQHQRKNDALPASEENENKEEDYREENWYSSDEESSNPFSTILKNLGPSNLSAQESNEKSTMSVPPVLPDIDVSAVSKLLSSVRETIQQKTEGGLTPPRSSERHSQKLSVIEEKRSRDPRLRVTESDSRSGGDIDLRGDVDLRHLPFKPAPPHQAATEIDASLNSHPPIDYVLKPIHVPKPDYSTVKPHPKYVSDPRLRKYHTGVVMAGPGLGMPPSLVAGGVGVQPPQLQSSPQGGAGPVPDLVSRDPRTRGGDVKVPLAGDPRRKSVLLSSTPPGASSDSDLRFPPPIRPPLIATYPTVPFNTQQTDVDLRLQAHSHFSYN